MFKITKTLVGATVAYVGVCIAGWYMGEIIGKEIINQVKK